MVKVYIAAKYHRRFELRFFADALKSHGVEVTSQWLNNGEEEADSPAAAAKMDLDDVDRSDVAIFFGEPRGSKNTGGGRWFELGYAYAAAKRIIVVLADGGDNSDKAIGNVPPRHETVFTSLPDIELVDTLDEAMRRVI